MPEPYNFVVWAWVGGLVPHFINVYRFGDWNGVANHGIGLMIGIVACSIMERIHR